MTTIARRIAAIPTRTSTETWAVITELLAPAGDEIRPQLDLAANTACMLIAEEHVKDNPIIVTGCGPQMQIYTLHGDDAVEGANTNEHTLTLTAQSDWQLSLPATGIDHDLARSAVDSIGHITVYDPTAGAARSACADTATRNQPVIIDLTALEK